MNLENVFIGIDGSSRKRRIKNRLRTGSGGRLL
jgi:hypothetical protein